jgi:hypothetical protein
VKIRLWGTEGECRLAAQRLMATPGLVVLSVSEPYADHGASVLVRVFIEARLDPPAGPEQATWTAASSARQRPDQGTPAQTMPGGRRRRALPPGGSRGSA